MKPPAYAFEDKSKPVADVLAPPPCDPNRYKPRHAWYLADAQILIRGLQQALWPLGWHVALGGGVLNHGYSDKDLDLYVLPIYRPGQRPSADSAKSAIEGLLGDSCGDLSCSLPPGTPDHEYIAHGLVFDARAANLERGMICTDHISGGDSARIDVFIVEPYPNVPTPVIANDEIPF